MAGEHAVVDVEVVYCGVFGRNDAGVFVGAGGGDYVWEGAFGVFEVAVAEAGDGDAKVDVLG